MAKRKSLTDRIYDRFYRWHERANPKDRSVFGGAYTRRNLRDAYEAGFKAARRDGDSRGG